MNPVAIQLRWLRRSGRPWALVAGVFAGLLLLGQILGRGVTARVLAGWPAWLYLAGPIWALAVWHEEGPDRRTYLWSQPVGRTEAVLARVAAGLGWLLAGLAAAFLLGAALAALAGRADQLGRVSAAGWANAVLGPTVAYLLVSVLPVASRYPVRWLAGFLLVPLLLVGAADTLFAVSERHADLVSTLGAWMPGAVLRGPLVADVQRITEAAAGGPGRVSFQVDAGPWGAATALWLGVAVVLLVWAGRRHPDC